VLKNQTENVVAIFGTGQN